MNIGYLIGFIFLGVIFLMFYISVLTGFFATYYYNENTHKKIIFKDSDAGYFSHILYIAGLFLINIFVFFQNKFIGIIIYIFLIALILTIWYFVKRNMKNIIKINCTWYRPPATVIFNTKIMTLLLSPFSNFLLLSIFSSVALIMLLLTWIIVKYF